MDYETGTDRTSELLKQTGIGAPVQVGLTSARSASSSSAKPAATSAVPRDFLRGNYSAIKLPTLVEYCLHYAGNEVADSPAFTHVTGQPGTHDRLTFAQLDQRARAIAAEIQKRGGTGHPVLVVQEPGVDYAASLFGCLYARAIAVPVYPPQMLRLQQTLPRLQAMIANAGAKCMLSSRSIIGDSLIPLWGMPDAMAIAVDEVSDDSALDWDGVLPGADDVALLQYTSGSTGNPRGVVLPHRVLLSNLNAVIEHYHFDGANSVQWVPPYHDMGLIGGIFVPIFRGVETVVVSPVDFVRDPLLWLKCIDYYNGSSNGSPNFGYELCVRRIKDSECEEANLDLSSWKVAIAGAEPVRASTLRRFTEKFARFGFAPESFCPAFGMAETTVVATGKPFGELFRSFTVDASKLQSGFVEPVDPSVEGTGFDNGNTLELVSSGVPVDSMSFEIVDPEAHVRLPEHQVGEIWIAGDSVATGYWNDEVSTQKTFHAKIAGEDSCKYLRTGDLGTRIDGELIVTGRLKELIIVAGRNLYPHDVEEVVQSVSEAFRPDTGTAFSIDTGDSEELVIVQELWRPKKFLAEDLLPQIVASVFDQTQVTPYSVVLVRSGSLPKTSSGKLRRTDTKTAFLNGELTELSRWQASTITSQASPEFEEPNTATEKTVSAIWSRLLNVDKVGRQDDFFHLGGGSLLVGEMLTEIAETLGIEVSISTAFRKSTLAAFAQAVDSEAPASEVKTIPQTELEIGKRYPLAHAQRRFWLLEQLGQEDAFVYVPISIELDRPIAVDLLRSAIDDVVEKHPILRTRVVEQDGDVWQIIDPLTSNVSHVLVETGNGEPNQKDALFRVAVHNGENGTSRIELVFHHMICDASSVEIVLADIQAALESDDTVCETADSLAYVDYAAWDQGEDQQQSLERGDQYWQQRLAGVSHELNFPHGSSACRDSNRTPEPTILNATVSKQIGKQIDAIATANGLTASMVYLTVFQSVLARYGDSDDFAITVPTSNRPATSLGRTVGCFVNPITYRATVESKFSLRNAMQVSRDGLLADLDHADVPFQRIVAAAKVTRNAERMPLSQVMFLYQPAMRALDRLGESNVLSIETDYHGVTAYDISLVVQPRNEPGNEPGKRTWGRNRADADWWTRSR